VHLVGFLNKNLRNLCCLKIVKQIISELMNHSKINCQIKLTG
jgi:hypothetical protein